MSKRAKAAAIEYLEQLLKIVRECPVLDVEYDREAESVEIPGSRYMNHVPTGVQTHTITVVANVRESVEQA